MKYLLIFEDGTTKCAHNFNEHWIDDIDDGILTVIKFDNDDGFLELVFNGLWVSVEEIK